MIRIKKKLSISLLPDNIAVVSGEITKKNLEIDYHLMLSNNILENYLQILNIIIENKFNYFKTSLNIGSGDIKFKNLEMDYLDDKIIHKYMNEKYKNNEESVFQYNIFDDYIERKKHLNIFYMKKDRVKYYRDEMYKYKLRSSYLNLNNYSIIKLLNFNDRINDDYLIMNKNIIVVDLSLSKLNITIFNEFKVIYINEIDIEFLKHADITNVKNIFHLNKENPLYLNIMKYIKKIADLLNMTIDFFQRKYNEKISYIVLIGSLSSIKGIDNYLTNELKMQVIVLKKLNKIKMEKDLNLYASAIGGLINGRIINNV